MPTGPDRPELAGDGNPLFSAMRDEKNTGSGLIGEAFDAMAAGAAKMRNIDGCNRIVSDNLQPLAGIEPAQRRLHPDDRHRTPPAPSVEKPGRFFCFRVAWKAHSVSFAPTVSKKKPPRRRGGFQAWGV